MSSEIRRTDTTAEIPIPLLPTSRPCLGSEELEALKAVFDTRWLGTGVLTRQFQDEIAEFLGVRNVIAVNSGTAAIHIALEALGIGPGDEVIVPSFTFISSIQAVVMAGAQPIFCDIELESGQMDVSDAVSRISARTRAILPVHYGGSTVDMEQLLAAAQEQGLYVVEDAAHAFGSTYHGQYIGSFGDVTCFSFDPIKNITCGTGGAVVTNDDDIASRLRLLSNVGLPVDSSASLMSNNTPGFDVASNGYRYRMADFNAAVGLQQLRKAEQFRSGKIKIAKRYDEAFRDLPGVKLIHRDWNQTFPFNYTIRVCDGKQTELAMHLRTAGIGTTIHFKPNHLHSAFAGCTTKLPATEQLFNEILTLPFYVDLSDEDVELVVNKVREFFFKIG